MDRFRILIVDDNRAIHEDFRKVLCRSTSEAASRVDALEAELFGDDSQTADASQSAAATFDLECATQGEAALELVTAANEAGAPFALAFIDMRMPPGWDGLTTIEALWAVDPHVQIVICSAYSDYSWSQITDRLGTSDQLLILKKPFDSVEVMQLAHAMTSKWKLTRQWESRLEELDVLVAQRTRALHDANEELKAQIEARDRIEAELRLAQKLEAVGQLAGGIAHEINTPMQFLGNSLHFLEDAFSDLTDLVAVYQRNVDRDDPNISKSEQVADVEFLLEEIPVAMERSLGGVQQVSDIVAAMKEFAHPGERQKQPASINEGIRNTLAVATNEYKYDATVELELAELPLVECHLSDLNQVLLNLIVNAAHSIHSVRGDEELGTIRIVTSQPDERTVRIVVTDTGAGVPEDIKRRIFDPFFTTKEVGKGTGQGLAIAHAIVVDRHGGRIRVLDREDGPGARFEIDIPIRDKSPARVMREQVA